MKRAFEKYITVYVLPYLNLNYVIIILPKFRQLGVRSLDRGVQAGFHFWKIYLDACCLSRIF